MKAFSALWNFVVLMLVSHLLGSCGNDTNDHPDPLKKTENPKQDRPERLKRGKYRWEGRVWKDEYSMSEAFAELELLDSNRFILIQNFPGTTGNADASVFLFDNGIEANARASGEYKEDADTLRLYFLDRLGNKQEGDLFILDSSSVDANGTELVRKDSL